MVNLFPCRRRLLLPLACTLALGTLDPSTALGLAKDAELDAARFRGSKGASEEAAPAAEENAAANNSPPGEKEPAKELDENGVQDLISMFTKGLEEHAAPNDDNPEEAKKDDKDSPAEGGAELVKNLLKSASDNPELAKDLVGGLASAAKGEANSEEKSEGDSSNSLLSMLGSLAGGSTDSKSELISSVVSNPSLMGMLPSLLGAGSGKSSNPLMSLLGLGGGDSNSNDNEEVEQDAFNPQKAAEEKTMRDKIRNYQRNDMIDEKTNVHVDLNFYSVPRKYSEANPRIPQVWLAKLARLSAAVYELSGFDLFHRSQKQEENPDMGGPPHLTEEEVEQHKMRGIHARHQNSDAPSSNFFSREESPMAEEIRLIDLPGISKNKKVRQVKTILMDYAPTQGEPASQQLKAVVVYNTDSINEKREAIEGALAERHGAFERSFVGTCLNAVYGVLCCGAGQDYADDLEEGEPRPVVAKKANGLFCSLVGCLCPFSNSHEEARRLDAIGGNMFTGKDNVDTHSDVLEDDYVYISFRGGDDTHVVNKADDLMIDRKSEAGKPEFTSGADIALIHPTEFHPVMDRTFKEFADHEYFETYEKDIDISSEKARKEYLNLYQEQRVHRGYYRAFKHLTKKEKHEKKKLRDKCDMFLGRGAAHNRFNLGKLIKNKVNQRIKERERRTWLGTSAKKLKPLKVVVSGHSVGGVMAEFMGLSISLHSWFMHQIHNGTLELQVATFGAPRGGNQAFAQFYDRTVPHTTRVFHESDLVPYFPNFYQDIKDLEDYSAVKMYLTDESLDKLDQYTPVGRYEVKIPDTCEDFVEDEDYLGDDILAKYGDTKHHEALRYAYTLSTKELRSLRSLASSQSCQATKRKIQDRRERQRSEKSRKDRRKEKKREERLEQLERAVEEGKKPESAIAEERQRETQEDAKEGSMKAEMAAQKAVEQRKEDIAVENMERHKAESEGALESAGAVRAWLLDGEGKPISFEQTDIDSCERIAGSNFTRRLLRKLKNDTPPNRRKRVVNELRLRLEKYEDMLAREKRGETVAEEDQYQPASFEELLADADAPAAEAKF